MTKTVIGSGELSPLLAKDTLVKTAWAYLVVSSDAQEGTLEHQRAWSQSVAREKGWHLEREFSDVATGKNGVRKLFTRLLAELSLMHADDRPKILLLIRLDRVGRGSIVDSQVALRDLTRLGVRVFTRDQGFVELDSAMNELMAAMQLAISRQENEVRREKSIAFHARKKAAGEFASGAPYGFILRDKRLAPYEPEAVVIRTMFEQRLAGWGYQRIAKHAAATAPGKLRPNGERRRIRWATSTVTTIFKNRRYRGAIVEDHVWDSVAQLRGQMVERPAKRWQWPLRGALFCTCGAQLLGEASGREGARTRYYVCRRFNEHGGRYPHHNAERLEEQFAVLLSRLEVSSELLAAYRPKPIDGNILRERYAEILAERKALDSRKRRAWELAEDGALSASQLAERVGQIDAQLAQLNHAEDVAGGAVRAHEAAVRSQVDVRAAIAGFGRLWPTLPEQAQRDVARALSQYFRGLWLDPGTPHRIFLDKSLFDVSGRRVDTLRNVDMAQRKADDSITKVIRTNTNT